MYSYFNAQHWNRVRQARAEQGMNKIPAAAMLHPAHRMVSATLRQRDSADSWTVIAVSEDWLLGRYLVATLEHESGKRRTCVVESISCSEPAILEQLQAFNAEFEVLYH